MRLAEFDYDLPEELIAQSPLDDRSASRLLVLHKATGEIEHRTFRDVTQLLQPGDLLVMNDTRVTALRLFGERPSGGKVEALLLRETNGRYEALMKPGKKMRPGQTAPATREIDRPTPTRPQSRRGSGFLALSRPR